MTRKKISIALKRFFLSYLLAAFVVCGVNAQGILRAQAGFKQYGDSVLQEKIFVHTDKSEYLSGEIIWFKLYCVDAALNKPLNLSKVAYVEVLDNTQSAIFQAKIALADGSGSGSFAIPVAIANGNYQLRAYTSWMKNFGPDYFFEKNITILNPLRSPEVKKVKTASYDIQFFPEGGNLVTGMSSNIGFKAVGKNGLGIMFKGAIINDHGDTVSRFQPYKFGMGHFAFTPLQNNSYKAIIKVGNDAPFAKELPAINSKGYAVQLTDTSNGLLNIKVNSNLPDEQIYLFAHTRGAEKVIQNAIVAGGTASFSFSKDKLGEGVSQITIFNAGGQPVCERLYFKRPKQNTFISAATSQLQYSTRKKVDLMIAAKDVSGKLLNSGLSLAVYRVDSLQNADQGEIFSYLWLNSDLRGHIESPGYYFKNASAEADAALDNLMLTQGWRRFNWANIIAGAKPVFRFLPEYNGHIITVKVTDSLKNAAKDVIALLAVPGKRVQVYPSKSDSEGRFLFNTKELYGPNEIVVQTITRRDTSDKLEVLTPFYDQYSKSLFPDLELRAGAQASLQQQSLSMQVQNIYAGNKLKRYYEPLVDSSGFFGQPYKTYKLDDFTRFTTMEEVLREYVREISVSRSNRRFHVTMIAEKTFLNGDPLVLVDGVPVLNIDKLMAVDPLKVQRLQVVRQRYFYGPSSYEGILNYTTYKGDLGGTEIEPRAVVIDYEGMQLQRQFYAPVYETAEQQQSRLPDFRNLLFWSPDVKTGKSAASAVSFYTSDQTGRYFGLIQGIAANGDAASQSFTFEVK